MKLRGQIEINRARSKGPSNIQKSLYSMYKKVSEEHYLMFS